MESSTVSSHSLQLPFDIYAAIIAQLPSPYYNVELCTLALTSKALSGEAIRELYRSVACFNRQTVECFIKCITGASSAHGALVRDLAFCLTASRSLDQRSEIEQDPLLQLTRDALKLLPNLQILNLSQDKDSMLLDEIPIGWFLEHATFRLTHLFIPFSFVYDLGFEEFLIRHSHSLRHIQFLLLELLVDDDNKQGGSQGRLEALDAVAAPGDCLRRILQRSQPTKIRNTYYDPESDQVISPVFDQRNITSCKFAVNAPLDSRALVSLGSNLRFLGLEVHIGDEEGSIYQPLSSLTVLCVLEIEWYEGEFEYYTQKLEPRLPDIIGTCFACCPSAHFDLIFSSIVVMEKWGHLGKKWERGVEKSVQLDVHLELDNLWSIDW